MKTLSYIDYCALPPFRQFLYKIYETFFKIIFGLWGFVKGVGLGIKRIGIKIGKAFKNMYLSFKYGDIYTKLSFGVVGISHIKRGQRIKGILMIIVELIFITVMVLFGGEAIYKFTYLGKNSTGYTCGNGDWYATSPEAQKVCPFPKKVDGDWSERNLLYGILALIIVVIFMFFYIKSVNRSYQIQTEEEEGKHIPTFKEDMAEFLNSKFHITLLALPILGVIVFSILPLIDMILMAFTNYDYQHAYPKYFNWVGLDNFLEFGNFGNKGFGYTFVEILKWTAVWAVLATFINFFLGIIVATIINRKGIKFKKLWRTCLVLSIAVPQFVSLMALGQIFQEYGPITQFIKQQTGMTILFWGHPTPFIIGDYILTIDFARILIVLINIWIGIPYTVLSTTGILMNVPEDLYESARIDGASPITIYFKITLKYIVFVMGPSLITTFIGNFNSFGVIYLLTGGGPKTNSYYGSAGHTDLLVTWLFTLTMGGQADYKMASVIGILIFIISATISLIVYRNSASFKNEEDFA